MHLLYIVPYAPTPIRTRPYHLLQQLARDGCQITLATLAGDDFERNALAHWRANGISVAAAEHSRVRSGWNLLLDVPTAAPLQAAYCWNPKLRDLIRHEIARTEFDVIQVEHLRGAWFGLDVAAYVRQLGKRIPVIWDSVDSITHLFEQSAGASTSFKSRLITRLELGRTRSYEAWLAQQFSRTLVVSEGEREAFCSLLKGECDKVMVVPNGVALDYFVPSQQPREASTILLTGKMSYHANVTAALYLLNHVMPRVWDNLPNAQVCIAGQNPPAELRARTSDRIRITGYLPDLRPVFHSATVMCAPLVYGAGTQNKVLEAMACGTAVVATPQALGALKALPEQDVLVGQDASALANQLIRVMTDPALRRTLETNGRAYVEQNHAWSASTRALNEIYLQARSENELTT